MLGKINYVTNMANNHYSGVSEINQLIFEQKSLIIIYIHSLFALCCTVGEIQEIIYSP